MRDGRVLAGLLTQEPLPRVAARMEALTEVARLKISDRGLVDVGTGRIVPLWVD